MHYIPTCTIRRIETLIGNKLLLVFINVAIAYGENVNTLNTTTTTVHNILLLLCGTYTNIHSIT